MNYLAHAVLAEPYAYSIIGNVAGDLVKGPLHGHGLLPRVAGGVRRHRRVDALTDAHPKYQELKALFPGPQRRTAGIVLDVLFDHYLCCYWSSFVAWPRDEFIVGVYDVLRSGGDALPAPLARVAPRWVAADWLRVYESLNGVDSVLKRLAQRSTRGLDLSASPPVIEAQGKRLEAGFHDVFGDVQRAINGL